MLKVRRETNLQFFNLISHQIKGRNAVLLLATGMAAQAQEVLTVKTDKSFDAFQLTSRFVLDLTREKPVVRTNEKSVVYTSDSQIIIQFESMEDAVNEVKVSDERTNVFYDLSGRKVQRPQKGIYIKNGKKVLVK
ncbi:MAG: hypothetical protein IKO73_01150 [Bacteroidaceae bacterium]|nr:hypothetical protein [Bacteroidaceae bacterium]